MSKLGELLQETRLKHGITFEKVTQQTRLSEDIVRQLEDGGFSTLPSYNHAKNFVRNYAEYLGLNLEEVAAMLEEECTKGTFVREPVVQIQTAEEPVEEPKQSSGIVMKYIVPAVIVIAILFAGIKIISSFKHKKEEVSQEMVQPQAQAQQEQEDTEFNTVDQKTVQDTINAVNSQEQSDQTAAHGTTPGQPADGTATPNDAAIPGGTKTMVDAAGNKIPVDMNQMNPAQQTANAKTAMKQDGTKPADDKALANNGLKKATLNFADVCWVHVKSDTGEELDFIADKKTHNEIAFKNYFMLDVGNAAVASVSYNGRATAGLGGYKVPAKGLKFAPDAAGELKYTIVK